MQRPALNDSVLFFISGDDRYQMRTEAVLGELNRDSAIADCPQGAPWRFPPAICNTLYIHRKLTMPILAC